MGDFGNGAIIPGFDEEKGDHLRIFLERVPGEEKAIVVHLGGRVDAYNTDYFQRALDLVAASGFRRVVFACEELGHVSASGISAFSRFGKHLGERGGGIAFVRMRQDVQNVFDILGLSGLHPIRSEVPKALEAIAEKIDQPGAGKGYRFLCPGCARPLSARHAGAFVCSSCRTKILLDERGMARAC